MERRRFVWQIAKYFGFLPLSQDVVKGCDSSILSSLHFLTLSSSLALLPLSNHPLHPSTSDDMKDGVVVCLKTRLSSYFKRTLRERERRLKTIFSTQSLSVSLSIHLIHVITLLWNFSSPSLPHYPNCLAVDTEPLNEKKNGWIIFNCLPHLQQCTPVNMMRERENPFYLCPSHFLTWNTLFITFSCLILRRRQRYWIPSSSLFLSPVLFFR